MSTSLFFQEQVRQSFNKVIDDVYPNRFIMQGLSASLKEGAHDQNKSGILNFRTNLDHFRKEYFFDTFTSVGMAEWYVTCGDKIPQVSMHMDRMVGKQEAIAIGFEWCEDDLLLAQAENTGLISKAMTAMKRGTDVKLEDIFWEGNANLGIFGLLNFPNVSVQVLPADGSATIAFPGGSPTLHTKTPAQMYRDLVTMSLAVSESSSNAFFANTMLLPNSVYNAVNTTIFSTTGDNADTVLTVFLRNQANNPIGIKTVRPIPFLDGKGTDEGGKAIIYSMDPENQEAILSQYFNVKPNMGGQEVNYKYSTKAKSVAGGVVIYRPLSILCFDNV